MERPSDLGIALQLAQGDVGGAVGTWIARQTTPWLQTQLTTAFTKMGLGSAAGALAGLAAPLLIGAAMPVIGRWFKRPSSAKPSDTRYMMNLQSQQVLQNQAEQALKEAVDTASRRAQGMMETARSLAGSNQYLGAVMAQAAAPAAADAAAQIVSQGLQNKTALLQASLQHERQRQLAAQEFAQRLQMQRIADEQRRREMMMQMILAMAMRNQSSA